MSVAKQRLVKIVAKGNASGINRALDEQSEHHEYITAVDETGANGGIATDDDDGGDSITYADDYEIAGNSDDTEGDAFFVEYVTEDDDNLAINAASTATTAGIVSGDSNDSELDGQLAEYEDDGDGDGGGGDEMAAELYNCSSCGMNFKSVTEHIQKHHPDQDVLIDISDEHGATTIKTEKTLDLNDGDDEAIDEDDDDDDDDDDRQETIDLNGDDDDDVGRTFITSDAVGMVDGELIVYGGGSGADDESLIDDVLYETDDSVVYTYDDATGQITPATGTKLGTVNKRTAPAKLSTVYKTTSITVQKPVKRVTRPVREKPKIPHDPLATNDHVCPICNTAFYSAKSLKLHARMHLPVKSKTLDEACDMDTDGGAGGEQDAVPREKFYCPICGKYYDKTFEQVHVQMHNGEEKFNCHICNKVFPNEESLSMHSNAHQEQRNIRTKAEMKNIKLPYGCRYCGKEFARPHEKVKHERVHTGEKPYECELCGKCFRVSYCLTIHMRTHTDARPYVCPTCQKRFKAQSVYNHHLLTHSDERNYKCPYCPKTFKTSVQLSGHKNSHTKPFTCTECNRPFGSLYAVRAHMDSHKRPNHNLKHICEICGAKYARRFALNDHMKEQHKDVQFVIVDSNNAKKTPAKRTRKVKQLKILDEEDERELEAAGQSILTNMVEQEITISEIEHFDNEEEVVEMDDWDFISKPTDT